MHTSRLQKLLSVLANLGHRLDGNQSHPPELERGP